MNGLGFVQAAAGEWIYTVIAAQMMEIHGRVPTEGTAMP